MPLRTALYPLFCAVLIAWSGMTVAQQPKAASKGAPAQQAPAQKQATLYYDRYQASQRLRLRRDTCMRDEDMMAQYCVKKCQEGYLIVGGPEELPRQCRSEKPLPAGELPKPFRTQPAIQPVPPPTGKAVPGA